LLEAGFAKVTPNEPRDISAWAYDYAADKVEIIGNRAMGVACYDPGYTLVEKLQTISTKFRKQQEDGTMPVDFMRHYYDVWSLLQQLSVRAFIGTPLYVKHKDDHFPQADNKNIRENAAFLLTDGKTRALYERAYEAGSALYYQGKPTFAEILALIGQWKDRL
jgi:Nucleotidyl transferase AbiEii toxin, Type IV TA system